MNVLAMDIGKYKTVFCEYNSVNGEYKFGTVKTRPQEIRDLILSRDEVTRCYAIYLSRYAGCH